MKQIFIPKILRKFFILGVMIAGLAFIGLGDMTSTRASAPCCEECEIYLNDCLDGCGGNQACQTACFQQNLSCIRHCVFCG